MNRWVTSLKSFCASEGQLVFDFSFHEHLSMDMPEGRDNVLGAESLPCGYTINGQRIETGTEKTSPSLLRQWMVVSIFHQVILSMGNGFGMSC